eukprot:GHRQ01034925.1.p2 GENE.GHRQ01034925.1~~GHRQ01034925.1.p2  ORF type:complete len:120 (-),score=29.40 GHRQ01034925.1:323-682(-)
MVGDPKQLPPTVKCREAERLGLNISMFDRLQAMGLRPLLLDVQYRMHPALCEFPSAQFYGGLLRSWPRPADRPLPGGIAWPNPEVCRKGDCSAHVCGCMEVSCCCLKCQRRHSAKQHCA